MWVRRCDLDAGDEVRPPIPARIASNEEFVPPPESPRQKEYEGRVAPPSPKTPRVGGGQQGEADAVILVW